MNTALPSTSGPVNLPLSGSVPITQSFNPWMLNLPLLAGYVGSYTVNVGNSSNPAVEQAALSVASYGKQLGRIEDVLVLLLQHIKLTGLDADTAKQLEAFKLMDVADDALPRLRSMLEELSHAKKQKQG
ncbi:hypothetical protein [Pararobbsia silviterrae]|uniref:Uncharacterized protein n=1 Tax=Pararobbsia silviterrae TaxID=1792498 RepID=A0A494XI35_9BURK|nr:hypothetical protein [Pararobbsia silviterrae]RKP47744.1 hypothetical protein D7S86_22530 [Pararobbsia silviterrae]